LAIGLAPPPTLPLSRPVPPPPPAPLHALYCSPSSPILLQTRVWCSLLHWPSLPPSPRRVPLACPRLLWPWPYFIRRHWPQYARVGMCDTRFLSRRKRTRTTLHRGCRDWLAVLRYALIHVLQPIARPNLLPTANSMP
jgi:hypothetical protein